MLRDDRGNGDGRPGAPRNVLGEGLEACSITLSRRLLQYGSGGHRQPHGVRRHDRRFSCVLEIARQRSFDTDAGIRLSRPQARRSLVSLRTEMAGSPRGGPSAPRGLARYARRRFELLLACRSQTLRGGLGLTYVASADHQFTRASSGLGAPIVILSAYWQTPGQRHSSNSVRIRRPCARRRMRRT